MKNLGINSKLMPKFCKYQLIKIKENHQGHFSFSAVEVEDVDREID